MTKKTRKQPTGKHGADRKSVGQEGPSSKKGKHASSDAQEKTAKGRKQVEKQSSKNKKGDKKVLEKSSVAKKAKDPKGKAKTANENREVPLKTKKSHAQAEKAVAAEELSDLTVANEGPKLSLAREEVQGEVSQEDKNTGHDTPSTAGSELSSLAQGKKGRGRPRKYPLGSTPAEKRALRQASLRGKKTVDVPSVFSSEEVFNTDEGKEVFLSRAQRFFEDNADLGSAENGLKIPFETFEDGSYEPLLTSLISIVEGLGVEVSFDRVLASPYSAKEAELKDDGEQQTLDDSSQLGLSESPLENPHRRQSQSPRHIDMLDAEIYRSVAERFVNSTRERIDPSKLSPSNKVYIAKWTNRVAMWRFFERYVVPLIKSRHDEIKSDLKYQANAFVELGGAKPNEISYLNPFAHYAHAFPVVMNAWMPCIKKVVKIFVTNTRGGFSLQEDFLSISTMAFLHALEKQAMSILANAKVAQGIPFPKRLEFAVRKSIYSELPDLTGPVRVPVESKQRKHMPLEVSLDSWNDDSDFY